MLAGMQVQEVVGRRAVQGLAAGKLAVGAVSKTEGPAGPAPMPCAHPAMSPAATCLACLGAWVCVLWATQQGPPTLLQLGGVICRVTVVVVAAEPCPSTRVVLVAWQVGAEVAEVLVLWQEGIVWGALIALPLPQHLNFVPRGLLQVHGGAQEGTQWICVETVCGACLLSAALWP